MLLKFNVILYLIFFFNPDFSNLMLLYAFRHFPNLIRLTHPYRTKIYRKNTIPFLLFLCLLLVHVSIVVPFARYAACLAIATCTLPYAEVQELLLHHYFGYLLISLGFSAVYYNFYIWANRHHALL